MARYVLEIYEPGSRADVLAALEAESPFATITKGDLIHPGTLAGVGELLYPDRLCVVEVEHILMDGEEVNHKICLYTDRVSPGNLRSPESRLSKRERFLLASQLRTLELLVPAEAEDLAQHREALEQGYELHYPWLFQHFYDGMSVSACKEVLDILDMYRAITFSARRSEKEVASETFWFPFPGFDGNNETSQVGYTRYFIHRLGRYQELAVEGEHTSFNSHMESLPKYRAMLRVWEGEFGRSHELTAEQIRALLETRA